MLKDITLGQYYQTNSLIHRLDPRVKLLGTLVYVISLFFPASPGAFALATLFLFTLFALSGVPVYLPLKGLKPLLFLILFTGVVNLFLTPGRELIKLGFLTISDRGLVLAAYLILRLIFLVMGSSLMTYTTTPGQLTAGLEQGLHFLTWFHLPVSELAMMMSIAMRFIPILREEMDKIMKAQMSRGVDFETGGLFSRASKLVPILVPLFVSAFRRAGGLAEAMEARGYQPGAKRSRLHPLCYRRRDCIAYLILFIYMAAMLVLSFGHLFTKV